MVELVLLLSYSVVESAAMALFTVNTNQDLLSYCTIECHEGRAINTLL
jgi:hypothetical protein